MIKRTIPKSVKQKVVEVKGNQVTLVSNNGKRYNVPLPEGMKLQPNQFVEVEIRTWSIMFSHITPKKEELSLEEQIFMSEQLDGCY